MIERDDDDGFGSATTMARPRPRLLDMPGASFRVHVSTPGEPDAAFEVGQNQPTRTLIGKSPVCEIRLKDPEVSRRHAALEVVGARLWLTDLDSTNGTSVDGLAIGRAYLSGGELIRIGSATLRVERIAGTASPIVPFEEHFGDVWGASLAMRRLYVLCRRLALTEVPVVLEGETGTGKERLARALHDAGPRKKRPFIVFDCTAVTPSLIESELFGHERGAFTGSVGAHRGVFERADGGTLLVDEIGDLPPPLQAKLLRAIETSRVTRVGGEREFGVDVRLLFATRRDLDKEVQEGRFRDDLFHRIAVARLELPPLRARHGDIALLATRFWQDQGGDPRQLDAALIGAWEAYGWPGNVRELRNAVMRRVALGDLADAPELRAVSETAPTTHASLGQGDTIGRILAEDLPLEEARKVLRQEFESRYVAHALERSEGNVGRAAAFAGVAHRHFQRIKAKYEGG
ncbi:MAG: sigma 54-interacting transcriptional regulator [Polyangiaceae bacterium]